MGGAGEGSSAAGGAVRLARRGAGDGGRIRILIDPSHEMAREGVQSHLNHFDEFVFMTNLLNM